MSTPDLQDELVTVIQQLREVKALRDEALRKVQEEYEPKIAQLELALKQQFANLGFAISPVNAAPTLAESLPPTGAAPARATDAARPGRRKSGPSPAVTVQLEDVLGARGALPLRELAVAAYGDDGPESRAKTSARLTYLLNKGRVKKLGRGSWGLIESSD
jgi:hypothetical protein